MKREGGLDGHIRYKKELCFLVCDWGLFYSKHIEASEREPLIGDKSLERWLLKLVSWGCGRGQDANT